MSGFLFFEDFADSKRVSGSVGGLFCLNLPVQGLGCSLYDGILLIPPHT